MREFFGWDPFREMAPLLGRFERLEREAWNPGFEVRETKDSYVFHADVPGIMSKDVATCRVEDTCERAAQLLWERDIGCLPILDAEGHIAGIITDRDICMAAYTRGEPLRAIPVRAVMSSRVVTYLPDDELAAVEKAMSAAQVRRMPVIDEHGHAVGMVSLNDLARATSRTNGVTATEVASTLAAICTPRQPAITGVA